MAGGEHPEQLRHQGDVENRNHAKVESAAHLPGLGVEFLEEIFDLMQNRARMLLKNEAS